MLERLGSSAATLTSGLSSKKVYALDVVKICDGFQELNLNLAGVLESGFQDCATDFSTKAGSLADEEMIIPTYWTSREAEALGNRLVSLGNGAGLDGRLLCLLQSGHISAYRMPSLVNECIRYKAFSVLHAFLAHCKDVRELDIAKVVLFSLGELEASPVEARALFLVAIQKPFRRGIMVAYLKHFGSQQVESLLRVLLELQQESEGSSEESPDSDLPSLAVEWTSILLDAQYTLLALQPAFLPLLKQLHERVGEALLLDGLVTRAYSLVQGLQRFTACPLSTTKNEKHLDLLPDYTVERSIDL